MEVRVSSTVEAPKKYQFIEFESGDVGDSKFPQDIVSLPLDFKSYDNCTSLASGMTDAKLRRRPGPGEPNSPTTGCERLQRALSDCHRRIPAGRARESACRQLNRSMAECLVSVVCPDEVDAVRTLCSSSGTSLKRSQCQGAQLSLAVCLSSHQI